MFAHDRAESADLLAGVPGVTTEHRLNRGERKRLFAMRSYVLTPITEPKPAKSEPVRFAVKLTTLKLTQLFRRQAKFARLASRAKHILAKMSPEPSRLKAALQAGQDSALASLGQVCAEIRARSLAAEGRLAETEQPSGLSGEHDVVLDAIQQECLHGN